MKTQDIDILARRFHHFNYRVIIRTKHKELIYTISEVWYDKKNNPTFWDKKVVSYTWGYDLNSLKLEMERITTALDKPVLKEVKISKGKYKLIEEK